MIIIKKIIFLFIFTIFFVTYTAQEYSQEVLNEYAQQITNEANKLYLLERGSWIGTDIFFQEFPEKSKKIGGYITYFSNDKTVTTLFYSNDNMPKVVASFSFDLNSQIKDVKVNSEERKLTKQEEELRLIRENVIKEIKKGTFYKFYENTSPNIIPIIENNEKKAYILTASKKDNVLIMGNDYLLTFDNKYNLKDIEEFHNSMISTEIKLPEPKIAISGIHTHVKGKSEFITPTDLVTLRLYANKLKLESYSVISDKYISTWYFNKKILTILPKENQ